MKKPTHFTRTDIHEYHPQWRSCDIDFALDKLMNKHGHHDKLILFVDCYSELFEDLNMNGVCEFLHRLRSNKPNWKIIFIADVWYKKNMASLTWPRLEMFLIDWDLYSTGVRLLEHHVSATAFRWPWNQSRFLCQTGSPLRLNRLGLLWKFYQLNLLDPSICLWSMFRDRSPVAEIRFAEVLSYFPDLSSATLRKFYNDFQNSLDSDPVPWGPSHMKRFQLQYDVRIYTQTKFSVISETSFANYKAPSITEKTYKAIMNHHPFILAGDVGACRYLNSKAFVSYDQFMLHPDYDTVEDPVTRLDQVVQNAQHWLVNIHSYKNEITEITRYNFDRMIHLYKEQKRRLEDFIRSTSLDFTKEQFLIHCNTEFLPYRCNLQEHIQHKHDTEFAEFYNNVRDPDWPDCTTELNFFDLSQDIQNELCVKYGYVHNSSRGHQY